MSFQGGGGRGGGFDFDPSRVPKIKIPKLPKIPTGSILPIAIGLFGVIALFSAFYQVQPDEAGVLTRFGKYSGVSDPGLHVKIPFVDRVQLVPVERQLKQEFGFRTQEAGVRTQYRTDVSFLDESLMLTGDLNVGVVEWIVQYKVKDAYAYLFNVRELDSTFRDMSEAVMRQVVGDHSVDEVLTIGREEIAMESKELLQELCDLYETGIDVQQLVLQDVHPPDPVKPSFNEVNEAIQEKERLTNEALAEYNQAIPRARGVAQQTIQEAEGYAAARVNRAQGEAARFESIYAEYRKAPRVTRNRMYLETLNEVLPKLGKKVIIDDKGAQVLPLLNLLGEKQP